MSGAFETIDEPASLGSGACDRAPEELPLAGVRVVEFGMAAVVPELCWMLSELGAEVLKIESVMDPVDSAAPQGGRCQHCLIVGLCASGLG